MPKKWWLSALLLICLSLSACGGGQDHEACGILADGSKMCGQEAAQYCRDITDGLEEFTGIYDDFCARWLR